MRELFTTAYWSSGSTPVRLRRRSSKRRKRLANWPVAWTSDWFRPRWQLADLLGRPAGCLFGQGGVGLGLGHLDEGLDLVERQLSLGQRVRNLRELPQLGRCGDPFPGRGRGDATPLHEPADHGGGAVDPPGPAPIELHHGCQQLTLVGGDGPVVLRHAGHQRFGAPGHRIGPGTVTEGGRTRHAGGERSHRVGHVAPDRSCPRPTTSGDTEPSGPAAGWLSDSDRPAPTPRGCGRAGARAGG